MNKFEEVCWESCEEMVESLPKKIPKHKFSKSHKKKINELFPEKTNIDIDVKKVTFKTLRYIAIAALLFILTMIITTASTSNKKYVIKEYPDHSEYIIVNSMGCKNVEAVTPHYIPEGFEKIEEDLCDSFCIQGYLKDDHYFSVNKYSLSTIVEFDTETYGYEEFELKTSNASFNAVYFPSTKGVNGIIFNNGIYILAIVGSLSREEIIKVAQNVY